MHFTTHQLDKIQAILLNKVSGLSWYYFHFNFNDDFRNDAGRHLLCVEEGEIQDVLRDMQVLHDGSFEYNGPELSSKALTNIIMRIILEEPGLLKKIVLRIFDRNLILNDSTSEEGLIGRLNLKNRKRREKKFWRQVSSCGRPPRDRGHMILAEGDSWFEFPPFWRIDVVCDILDQLMRKNSNLILSRAAAGDWLSNMVFTGEYIEELSQVMPDAFLLSGGGNDLVGKRLAYMVRNQTLENPLPSSFLTTLIDIRSLQPHETFVNQRFRNGLYLLNQDFFNFINAIFLQYFVFFYQVKLKTDKFHRVKFLTHGYDYAIPRRNTFPFSFDYRKWIAFFVGMFTGTGTWLHLPLQLKGITTAGDQQDVIYTIIYEFNEMLLLFDGWSLLPNVSHIDLRGTSRPEDWFDEIHLNSKAYRRVADCFEKRMNHD